ncbi:F-box/FBD/LRR-repeat protein At1g16930 [Linum perenne]
MKNNSSSYKLGEYTKCRRGERRVDRLSNLPDSVLHHILSFLSTKSAVQTTVLSRRWRCVWKHVPVIHICGNPFDQSKSFNRFVDMVLSLRYPLSLSKMIFIDHWDFEGEREDCRFMRIIKYALSHHTKHLTIYLQNGGYPEKGLYPFSALFGLISDSDLKSLELREFTIDAGFQSSGFGFRVLTRLKLDGCMVLANHEEVIDPFSKFPCLRTLELLDLSTSHSGKVFRISGLQLISLNIIDSYFDKIEVYAPKLKSFAIVDQDGISEFSKLTLPSLEYADIWVEFMDDRYDHEYVSRHMISLFQGLNNVMSLRLKCFTVEVLNTIADYFEEQPSPFTRLKSLIVGADRLPLSTDYRFHHIILTSKEKAALFELEYDKQFIMASDTKEDHDVYAFEYSGDPNGFDMVRPGHNWGVGVRVGNSGHAEFKALNVLGVVISGKQLTELSRDLILDGSVNNQTFCLSVNRLGHCLLIRIKTPTMVMLRINDYFGWSKYGLILPKGSPTNVWNKCDMFNGATIVDTQSIMIAVEQSKTEANSLKKNLEDKQKRLESLNSELELCKKELECTKQVVKKSNEVESLLNKLVHDKEKE